jgi:hypothetical protein
MSLKNNYRVRKRESESMATLVNMSIVYVIYLRFRKIKCLEFLLWS